MAVWHFLKRYAMVGLACGWLVATLQPAQGQTPDTLIFIEDFEGPFVGLGRWGQLNNATNGVQNVWGRGSFRGVNAGTQTRYITPRECANGLAPQPVIETNPPFAAGVSGSRGLHLISAFCPDQNQNHTGYNDSSFNGQTASSRVAILTQDAFSLKGLGYVQMDFRLSVGGNANDFLQVVADNSPSTAVTPLPDGAGPNSAVLPRLAVAFRRGNTVADSLRNLSNHVALQYALPYGLTRAQSQFRMGFYWQNNGDGQFTLPGPCVDNVLVQGIRFRMLPQPYRVYCHNSVIEVPYSFPSEGTFDATKYQLLLVLANGNVRKALTPEPSSEKGRLRFLLNLNDGFTEPDSFRLALNYQYEPTPESVRLVSQPEVLIGFGGVRGAVTLTATGGNTQGTVHIYCPGTPVTLRATAANAIGYEWYRNEVKVAGLNTPTFIATQPGIYRVDVLTGGCRVSSSTLELVPTTQLQNPTQTLLSDVQCYSFTPAPRLLAAPLQPGERIVGPGLQTTTQGVFFDAFAAGLGNPLDSYRHRYVQYWNASGAPLNCVDSLEFFLTVQPPLRVDIDSSGPLYSCLPAVPTLTSRSTPANLATVWYFRAPTATSRTVLVLGQSTYTPTQTGWYYDVATNADCTAEDSVLVLLLDPQSTTRVPVITQWTPANDRLTGRIAGLQPEGSAVRIYLRKRFGDWVNVGLAPLALDSTFSLDMNGQFQLGDTAYAILLRDTDCDRQFTDETERDQSIGYPYPLEGPINDGFSPNGDGINDRWVLRLNLPENYPNNRVTVWNRWGTEVFRKQPYDNNWDGADLPAGVYYFTLEYGDGQTPTYKGTVLIVR
jgi:gliding motility-associated-like protein